jgi:hypothetical protein
MQEGAVVNLYKVDFTGDIAVTTGPAGELFFGAVFDGVIPEMMYRSEGVTIVIGHVETEDDQNIHFSGAVALTPQQMRQTHQATNFSPLDCCRGLLHDLRHLQPMSLRPLVIRKSDVRQRVALAN